MFKSDKQGEQEKFSQNLPEQDDVDKPIKGSQFTSNSDLTQIENNKNIVRSRKQNIDTESFDKGMGDVESDIDSLDDLMKDD